MSGASMRERTVSAIHVEPHVFPLGDIGDGRQIVDRADIDRAGGRGDEEGRQPGAPILGYGFFECLDIDLVLPVHRNDAERIAAQSSQIHGLRDATVGARRCIGDQPFAARQRYPGGAR